MTDGGGLAGRLAIPVVIEVRAALEDFGSLEDELSAGGEPGIELRETDPGGVHLKSDVWQTVLVSLTSAAGLKAARDVLVSHIADRRAKVSITRTETGTNVTFEGNLRNHREVERLVHEITAERSAD